MKKLILNSLFCGLILLSASIIGNAQESEQKDAADSAYKVGQVWTYNSRPNEPASTFIVLKIDNHPKYGNIVHIAVMGLKMKNPRSPDDTSNKIAHMPFSEKAVKESAVVKLKENAELPDFEEGYNLWREAFDKKRAGFYTITIAEAVKTTEEGLNQ